MIIGAWLLIQYLDLAIPELDRPLERVEQKLSIAFWAGLATAAILRPQIGRASASMKPPSPRWSGTSVVLLTGLAAAVFVGSSATGGNAYLLFAAIGVVTIAVAAMIWRFATLHAADIGEARFESPASDKVS